MKYLDLSQPEDLEDTATDLMDSPVNLVPTGPTRLTHTEEECHKELVSNLRACFHCPHPAGTLCLKTKDDAHVAFTSEHVKGWAKAMVS